VLLSLDETLVGKTVEVLGHVGFVLAALAVVVVTRLMGTRIGVPFTILLTVVGLIYALLPGPNVDLDPDVVLVLVIPPLLYSAARGSSLVAIGANLRPIVSLSVLLVLATSFTVGVLVSLVVPGLPLAAGVVLGAAVAPPDPVASLSVGRRAGMPPRLTTLIEGEGLLNDATALTTYQVAVAATVGGGFSFAIAGGRLALAAIGGLAIGAAIALIIRAVRRWLVDPLIANAVSLAVPFTAYLAGEEAHVSGVLAVVVAGLMIGHDAPRRESGASRLQTGAVWQLVDFLLEGFVFLLIGQQLPNVISGLRDEESTPTIIAAAGVTVGVVLLLRPLWLIASQYIPAGLHTRLGLDPAEKLSRREVVALSWAGTRGVISLAAIFAVPLTVETGAEFPKRDLLLFCTYTVVLITLVGQGLTFAPLLRRMNLRADEADEAAVRNEARLAAIDAALTTIDDLVREGEVPDLTADALRATLTSRANRYRARLEMLQDSEDGEVHWTPEYQAAVTARRAIINAQHDELVRWRDDGRLPDTGLRKLQRELDHEEGLLPDR
jgi:CPA1 family monovalent cation:H+ antiporter